MERTCELVNYADLTINNPSYLKRFSHSRRFDLALELLSLGQDEKVLDYGTGDGFMLIKLLSKNPQLAVGYEPMEKQYRQLQESIRSIQSENVVVTDDLSNLKKCEFDKICCLEVLEHLTEGNQRALLSSIKRVLSDEGIVVISVPLEIGVSSLLKNLARGVLRQQNSNATAVNIVKCFLGLKIERGDHAYIFDHIGFDYRDLEKLFDAVGFKIQEKWFSPFKVSGYFINSQVLFRLKKVVVSR